MAARGPKSISKLLIAGGVVCALLVVASGVLHTRAETAAVADNQKQSAAFIKNAIPDLVVGYNLAKPLPDNQASALGKAMHAPAGSAVVIYSLDGLPVYPANAAKPDADAQDALTSAARGHVANVEGTDALVVFAPIQGKNGPAAVAAVSTDRSVVQGDVEGPLDAYKTPLMALAVLFLLGGLGMLLAGRTRSRSKKSAAAGGALGFVAPVAAAAATEDKTKKSGAKRSLRSKVATEDRGSDEERTGAHDREVAIRQALEDQLEQLRTQLQTQDDRSAGAVREMQAQLAAASKRASEAEARLAQAGGPAAGAAPQEQQPRDREMVERLRAMDAQLGQAKASANEANARAESLEAQLAATLAAPAPSANTSELEEQLRTLRAQLDEAEVRATDAGRRAEEAARAASDSEQRARSVDSIRDDLEVRLAQLGSKAGELEQKAGQLDRRLSEANEGGDAVRAEIATLTSALAIANARVEELEGQAVSSADTADAVAAADAETARLRGELALQMERAQTLEERVAALQADVFAARRGIEELPPEGSEQVDEDFRPAFASALDEPAHALGRSEPAFVQSTAATAEQAAASSFAPPASIVEEATSPQTEVEATAPSEPASSGDQDSYQDIWAAAYGSPTPATQPETDAEPASETEHEPEFRAETEPDNGRGSPDDDLWALRERLARATELPNDQQSENAPS